MPESQEMASLPAFAMGLGGIFGYRRSLFEQAVPSTRVYFGREAYTIPESDLIFLSPVKVKKGSPLATCTALIMYTTYELRLLSEKAPQGIDKAN